MLTIDVVEAQLRKLGLSKGMYVEVHSSLSSFGQVDGGADTIIEALMRVVTPEGAIIMSSMPMSKPMPLNEKDVALGLTCKIKILDPDSTVRTGMGLISDTFRRRPDVKTGEGLFRVSAWGREIDENSQGYSHLHVRNGHGLLLGVDIYRLTSMHYVESYLPPEITRVFEPPESVRSRYPASEWWIEAGSPPEKAWYKIQALAYEKGYIQDLWIGEARCMFFRVNDVINLYKEALIQDPFGLYGLRPPEYERL
jgi:aminoglycoside N3'-acetyltransferase